MQYPLAHWPTPRLRRHFPWWLALTLGLTLLLGWIGEPLRTPAAPAGIVSFEFAGNADGAATILNSWNQAARQAAQASLWLDFLYMPVYSTMLAIGTLWASRRLGRMRLGSWLAWGQWGAALLDAVENVALLLVLHGETGRWPEIAWVCAAVKFGLVGLGIGTVLAGALDAMMERGRGQDGRGH